MSPGQRALLYASIDPNGAIRSHAEPSAEALEDEQVTWEKTGSRWHRRPAEPQAYEPAPGKPELAVTVRPPMRFERWRFFLWWCLIKIACRIYPFEFQIYRPEKLSDTAVDEED